MSADAQGPGGADSPADGSASRPSKNNRQGPPEPTEPRNLPGPSRRPVAVRENTTLRDEARAARVGPGRIEPVHRLDADDLQDAEEVQSRTTHRVLDEWRRWMNDYATSHIEYESPEGDTVRAPLENSYQEGYSRRYYAKLKDLERGIGRQFDSLTTVMLTFTASHRNAEGGWRCPADHMRDVVDGWDTARKQLHRVLGDSRWEYARIMEPHEDGYGHLHVAVFVEADELDGETFRPVMRSHVGRCDPAGSEAHGLDQVGLGDAVSVSEAGEIDNLGSYLSEYLGIYGEEETALDRPASEQMFYAVTWATNSRRLDFSNGAQEIISGEQFRRETGLRPEDRGEVEESEPAGDAISWTVESLCEVSRGEPHYYDPTVGGVNAGPIDGRPGVDPPPTR